LTSDFLEVFDLSPNVPGGTYARFAPPPLQTPMVMVLYIKMERKMYVLTK